jgi:hypothetical protein
MEVSKVNELDSVENDSVEKDQLNQEDLEIVAGGEGESEQTDPPPIIIKSG